MQISQTHPPAHFPGLTSPSQPNCEPSPQTHISRISPAATRASLSTLPDLLDSDYDRFHVSNGMMSAVCPLAEGHTSPLSSHLVT